MTEFSDKEKFTSMSAAVRYVIDDYPAGHQFYGNELKDDVVKVYPDAVNMYPDTILRMARRHRRYAFKVVDQNNSLYEKIFVESIIDQIKKVIPKPISCPRRFSHDETALQMELFSYS